MAVWLGNNYSLALGITAGAVAALVAVVTACGPEAHGVGREIKAEIPRKILMCPPSQHHVISGTVNYSGPSKLSMMGAQP